MAEENTIKVILAEVPENSESAWVDDVQLDKGQPVDVTPEQMKRLKLAGLKLDSPAEAKNRASEKRKAEVELSAEKATT